MRLQSRVCIAAIFAAGLWVSVVATVRAQFRGFPDPTPMAGANPSVRHQVVVQIPTELVIERTADSLSIALDGAKRKPATITVGEKMITGVEDRTFVYPKGEPRPSGPGEIGLGGTDFNFGARIMHLKPEGIPVKGKSYVIEVEWTIFETDIPPQHMWSPRSGKYKILLEGKLQKTVE